MNAAIVVVAITVVVLVLLAILLSNQGRPGRSTPRDDVDPPGSGPAGPGAEGMNVPEAGDVSPGPEPE